MDDKEYRIFEEKLTEKAVSEIEALMEIGAFRSSPKLKHSVALMVILTHCTPTDSFFNFHERLTDVFVRMTSSPHQDGTPRRTFGRPIFSKDQGQIKAEICEPCLCTWQQHDCVSVDVPTSYREGFKSAIMYLIVSDISRYFSYYSLRFAVTAAIEVPCLLEMFLNSSPNNQKNLDALIGEYVALNGMCFEKGCLGLKWKYSSETYKFDFALTSGQRQTKVSVKSVNFSIVENFANPRSDDVWDPSRCEQQMRRQGDSNKRKHEETAKMVRFTEGENVLLHSCECEHCTRAPLKKIIIKQSMIIDGKRVSLGDLVCDCKKKLEEALTEWMPSDAFPVALSDLYSDSGDSADSEEDSDEDEEASDCDLAVVTLVAAKMFFELRYALCNFKQHVLRHPKRFQLRNNLISCMGRSDEARAQASCTHALIDRSNSFRLDR